MVLLSTMLPRTEKCFHDRIFLICIGGLRFLAKSRIFWLRNSKASMTADGNTNKKKKCSFSITIQLINSPATKLSPTFIIFLSIPQNSSHISS